MFYQKLCQTKFVDLIETNYFANLGLFRISHITFFRISYNLTGKWNLGIDYFQVITYCNFPNFGLIEKCYCDN